MSNLKFRPYSQLSGVLRAAARTRWTDSTDGDGWLYKTHDGALIDRIPDDSDIEAYPISPTFHPTSLKP